MGLTKHTLPTYNMKLVTGFGLSLVAYLARAQTTTAPIRCYTCSSNNYNEDGDEDCWNGNSETTADIQDCSTGQVCFATITWNDGFPASISRGCVANTETSVENQAPVEWQENLASYQGCQTDIENAENVHQTECGLVCSSSECNSPAAFTITTLIACNCQNVGENCDYTTGLCTCDAGREVLNGVCETTTTTTTTTPTAAQDLPNLACVQCSSEFDTSGACVGGSVAPTECADSAAVTCAAVSILVLDIEGNSVREIVERGCSSQPVTQDTCEFRSVQSGYPTSMTNALDGLVLTGEFTCRYNCESNGCNSEIATGDGPGIATATPSYSCASGEDYKGVNDVTVSCEFGCKSTLSYLENPYVSIYDNDGHTDKFGKIIKYSRGCASEEDSLLDT